MFKDSDGGSNIDIRDKESYYVETTMTLENYQKSLVSLALLVLLGTLAIGLQMLVSRTTEPVEITINDGDVTRGTVLSDSQPVSIRIPEIDVDTSFVNLGVDENKEIEVPDSYTDVGWYKHGPTPGELGPAVILGHVDSKDGPAVFYSLGQLDPGDRVEIDREDGTTAIFEVKTLERYEQQNFPTSLVYGDIDHSGLRLITCSGSYDRELQRYDYNLVVYAELIENI